MWTTDCGTHAQIEAAGGASEPIGASLILRNQQAQAFDHAKVPAVPVTSVRPSSIAVATTSESKTCSP